MAAPIDPAAVIALLEARHRAAIADAGDPWLRSVDADLAVFAPHRRLAVYGTLAPGECNHHHVAHLGGTWRPGRVNGWRAQRRFPVLTWDPRGADQPVQLLISDQLPGAWAALDAFEGADYRRILVAVHTDTGLEIANLYEPVQPVPARR